MHERLWCCCFFIGYCRCSCEKCNQGSHTRLTKALPRADPRIWHFSLSTSDIKDTGNIICKYGSQPSSVLQLLGKLAIAEKNLFDLKKLINCVYSFMEFTFVAGQEVSWKKRLVTIVTRNGNSFQMGRLDVLMPAWASHLFLFANCNHLLTFLHHWLHLLLQWFHIGARFIWDLSVTWKRIGIRFHIFSASGEFLRCGRWFSVFFLFFLLLDLTECLITTNTAV